MQNLFLGPLFSVIHSLKRRSLWWWWWYHLHPFQNVNLIEEKPNNKGRVFFLSLLWKDSSKTRLMRTVFENHQKCLRRILKCKQFWLLLFLLLSYQLLQFCCKMEHFMVISNTVNAGGFHHRLLSSFLFHFPTIVYKFFSNPNSSIARRAGLKLWQLVATETCRL